MKAIFILSKENHMLSKYEAVSLGLKKHVIKENFLITLIENFDYNRLAYTKKVLECIFICDTKNVINWIKKSDFSKYCKGSYSVRAFNNKISTKDLANEIFSSLKNPKVNLTNPKNVIEFHFTNDQVFCGRVLWENKQDYDKRKAHNRPELHPTSLHPRLARACINLTGIKKGKIVDPFCGSGGILIEAGFMGLKPVGYDIDRIMINRSKINLKYFKIKNFKLEIKDATKLKEKINYVITDPPYGRNTNPKDLMKIYEDFIYNLEKILEKKAVIIYDDKIGLKNIIKKTKLKIEKEFSYYIHKSMTKKIIVLGKV